MIDDEREETPPLGFEHRALWGMGFGPAKRDEILSVLHDIQRQQRAACLTILGVQDLCNLMMRPLDSWPKPRSMIRAQTPSMGERWRKQGGKRD